MNNDLMFSSQDNEHYTPLDFLLRVFEFSEGIDLDPCSNSLESPNVPATVHYVEALDGLSLPWFGRVWLNPPYGRSLSKWVAKAIEEYESKRVTEVYILVPARTDTQWHKSLDSYARCYLTGRLKFQNPANGGNSAPFPSVLFSLGKRNNEFKSYWSKYGLVTIPIKTSFDRNAYQKEYMRQRRAKDV